MEIPNNIEAEKALLGSILIAQDKFMAIDAASQIIAPNDFYRQANKTIYSAILQLYSEHKDIDAVTLTDYLNKHKQLNSVGGIAYITDLPNCTPYAGNIKSYTNIIKEKSIRRKLIYTAEKIKAAAEQDEDIIKSLDTAQQQIFNIAAKNTRRDNFINSSELAMQTMDAIEKAIDRKAKGDLLGLDTGFTDLNKLTGGFQKSDLIIIGARPAMGKTAFALSLAVNLTSKNIGVGFISLEMSAIQLGKRAISMISLVNTNAIRNCTLTDDEIGRITAATDEMSKQPLYIDDNPNLTIDRLRATARKLKHEHDIQVLIIDYIQLVTGTNKRENRNLELSEISRQLKLLARELDITVIALAQLSRGVETRQEKKPMLSDLRDSGAIEQDADIVGLLYREDYYQPETENKNIVELNIAKHRNGATGTIKLFFHKEFCLMDNLRV